MAKNENGKESLIATFISDLTTEEPEILALLWGRLSDRKSPKSPDALIRGIHEVVKSNPSDGYTALTALPLKELRRWAAEVGVATKRDDADTCAMELARHYGLYYGCVYVIELESSVWGELAFEEANQHLSPAKRKEADCFYVGSTSETPERRLEQHSNPEGGKASKIAKAHILDMDWTRTELIPLVFASPGKGGHKDAQLELEKLESYVATALRTDGHAAWSY
jgi:hypothetical protein